MPLPAAQGSPNALSGWRSRNARYMQIMSISPSPARHPCATAIRMQRTTGHARLDIAAEGGTARITDLYQDGAFKIRFPQRTATPGVEAILINTSGGLTGGDALTFSCKAGSATRLSVTTQACERVYRSLGNEATYDVTLTLAEGADLRWLPQETILYDSSRFRRKVNIEMARDARLLLVETAIFGRQDMGEVYRSGLFEDCWHIKSDGVWIHAEQFSIAGNVSSLSHPAGANGYLAMATLLLVAPDAESLLRACREILDNARDVLGGASFLQMDTHGKLVVRAIGRSGYALRKATTRMISALSAGASPPRIWTT